MSVFHSFTRIVSGFLVLLLGITSLHASQAPAHQDNTSVSQKDESAISVVKPLPTKKELRKRIKAIDGFKSMPKYIQYSLLCLAIALGILIFGGIVGLFFSNITQIFWYLGSAAAIGSMVFFILWLADVAGK